MKRIVFLAIVLIVTGVFIFSCGRSGDNSSSSHGEGISISMSLPSDLARLDAALIVGLQAEVEIAGVGTFPLTINPADDSVSGNVTDIPSGPQTITIRYFVLYGVAQTKLVLAEQTQVVNVVGGSNVNVSFPAANNTHPTDDTDGCSNLIEYAEGWDPYADDSVCEDDSIRNIDTGSGPTGPFSDLHFLSASEGWAVGEDLFNYTGMCFTFKPAGTVYIISSIYSRNSHKTATG